MGPDNFFFIYLALMLFIMVFFLIFFINIQKIYFRRSKGIYNRRKYIYKRLSSNSTKLIFLASFHSFFFFNPSVKKNIEKNALEI